MRILFLLYKNKCHSLYRNFIFDPPKGCDYITLDQITTENLFAPGKNIIHEIINKIFRNFKIINIAKRNNIDLIYSCDGILLFGSPIPWVVDLEHVTSFISHKFILWKYAKHLLPIILSQKNLKYIIPWTIAGKKSITSNLSISDPVTRKIIPVNLAVNQIQLNISKRRNRKLSVLFISSCNYNSEFDFFSKGGKIMAEVIKQLKSDEYEFIIRSKVPEKYRYLDTFPNVKIFESILEEKQYNNILEKSDVLLFPGYQSPGLAILDAMNFEMAIIAPRVFSNNEMVRNNYNGFLIDSYGKIDNVFIKDKYNILNVPSGERAVIDSPSNQLINDIVSKIIYLKGHREILAKMGRNSKKMLVRKYSLSVRNNKLGRIFQSALTK